MTGRADRTESSAGSAWPDVYDRLTRLGRDSLDVEQLTALAEAAFWMGRPRESIEARQREYAARRDSGDARGATHTACQLFHNYFDLDDTAVASGWLKRAHRHAESVGDQAEVGHVALADATWAQYNGDRAGALAYVGRVIDVARQHGDRDLEALGLATRGRILIEHGDVTQGLGCLDEAMVAVLGDELTPFVTGWVYCVLLEACQELGDLGRASEWTDLAVRWCEQHGSDSWYPGLCRLHQCEMRSLRGDWPEAEQEALRAAEELAPFGDYLIAEGHYLVGEIRRRRGDLAGAEEAFRKAHAHGRDPQPGLAMLSLARGDAQGADSSLQVALGTGSASPVQRGRLLAAQVRVTVELLRIDDAVTSAEELSTIAEQTSSPLLNAQACLAGGAVLLAQGDYAAAVPLLRQASAHARELSCPYEAAEAGALLGQAIRELGDHATANLELEAARIVFAQLGAKPDVARVDSLLGRPPTGRANLTDREVEVLRLVARGMSNREIASDLYISEHTVARHLSNIFRKLDVTSRASAASYAYEHHLA